MSYITICLKKIGLAILCVIGSLVLSSTIVTAFDHIWGDKNLSVWETFKMSQMSLVFIISGLIALFLKHGLKRWHAFALASFFPVAIILINLAIFPRLIESANEDQFIKFAQIMANVGGLTLLFPILAALALKLRYIRLNKK